MFGGLRAAAFHAQGLRLEEKGRLSEAEAAYRRALEVEPDRAETLFTWATGLRRAKPNGISA